MMQGDGRREAIREIIRLLPSSVQPYLVALYRESEIESFRETELYTVLRATLNSLAAEGALPRRGFLRITGMIAAGGLAPLLYPERAQGAWQAWTGFWQNINNNSYVTSAGMVTSGLVAHLDAGDSASYDGSSQTWKNLCAYPADGGVYWTSSYGTLSNGGLTINNLNVTDFGCRSNAGVSSGKYYWEVKIETITQVYGYIIAVVNSSSPTNWHPGKDTNGWGYESQGRTAYNDGYSSAIYSSYTANDIIGVYLDATNGKVWFSKNGVVQGGGDPSAGTNPVFSGLSGTLYAACGPMSISNQATARFSASSWTYSPPAGFSQLWAVSQSSYDFYRGSSSSSETSDPSFVGITGGKSVNDYFSFDGGDYFSLAGSNTVFLDSLHKAGAKFTICAAVSLASARENILFATGGVFSWPGISFQTNGSNYLQLQVGKSGSQAKNISATTNAIPSSQPVFVALSLDETGNGFFYVNGETPSTVSGTTWSGSYSGPTAAAADYPAKIGIAANSGNSMDTGYCSASGTRFYSLQIYNRALSKAEVDQNFSALRGRLGI